VNLIHCHFFNESYIQKYCSAAVNSAGHALILIIDLLAKISISFDFIDALSTYQNLLQQPALAESQSAKQEYRFRNYFAGMIRILYTCWAWDYRWRRLGS